MKAKPTFRNFLITFGCVTLAMSSASAGTIYWDGVTGSWNTTTTWTTAAGAATPNPGAIPGASDDLIFNRTGVNAANVISLNADQAALSLTFNNTSGTTIRGNTSGTTARSLTIGSGGITKSINSGTVEFGSGGNTLFGVVNIALSADQTWTNNSNSALSIGTRYFSSATDANVALGAFDLIIDGTGNTNIGVSNQAEAVLTGTGTLTKSGTGVLQMGGNNSGYSGNVTINGGVVNLGDSANGLGTGNNITLNGGVLESRWTGAAITRTQGTGANQIQITGGVSGLSGGGSGSGATTHNIGAITWGSATFNPTEFVFQSANAGGGTTTLSSAINLNGSDRTIRSDQSNLAGSGTFSGAITNSTGTAGLIKTGVGQHILSNASNSYNGNTTVNQGILTATVTGALPGFATAGRVIVAANATIGVRTGAWIAANIDSLRGAATWNSSSSRLGLDTTAGNFSYGSNITEALTIHKLGANTLTLSGDNSYSGGTILQQGTLIADSATALGSGHATFKGGTLQFTANSASSSFDIKNSTSTILLNTNGQNVELSGDIDSSNTGGLDKQGSGTLTLTGTNSFGGLLDVSTGTLVVDGGTTTANQLAMTGSNTTLSIINGGTLNATGGNFEIANNTDNTYISIIGGALTSTLNLGTGRDFSNLGYNPPRDNKDMLIDGDGVEGSAVFVARDVSWGRSTLNSDLIVTDGGQMDIRDLRIGSTYYGETGINNTVTLGGGTVLSVINSSQDVYVGYGDRSAASSNTLTVGANGDLNVTRHMYVGHVNNTANSDNPSTDNQLTVTGGGTASMNQLSLGFADADGRDAGANIVEVTSGGELSTSGTAYIGRADNPTSTSNANTLTVTGTDSSWDAGNQTVYVGFTNNASAQSNNNILTIGTGGSLTNVSNLIVGFGTGTETGNQLALNGGSLTATTVTVQASNSLEFGDNGGSLTGNVVNNGTLDIGSNVAVSLAGNISGTTGTITQTGTGTTTLSGTNSYTGTTTVNAGTLQFTKMVSLNNNVDTEWTAAKINVKSGATFAVNVDSAGTNGFTAAKLNTLLTNISVANTATEGMQAGAILGFDTSTATGASFTQGNAIADSTGASGGLISLTKLGAGKLILDQTNTYTGVTTITAGVLSVGSIGDGGVAGNLGQASNAAANIVFNGGTLEYTGVAASTDRNFTIKASGATIHNSGTGALTWAGNVAYDVVDQARTLNLTGTNSGGFNNFSGSLTNNGAAALTVNNDGSWILSGTNTYTGDTTVSSGALAVNGTLTSDIIVQSGATMQGSGSTTGSVTVEGGGTHAAGNSIESFAQGSLTLNASSTFDYEIDRSVSATVAGDLTAVTGSLNLDPDTNATTMAILALTDLNTGNSGSWDLSEKLTLISYSGAWDGGLFEYLGNTLTDDSIFTFSGAHWLFNYNDTTAGTNFTGDLTTPNFVTMTVVIPETSTAMLSGLGALALLRRRRR